MYRNYGRFERSLSLGLSSRLTLPRADFDNILRTNFHQRFPPTKWPVRPSLSVVQETNGGWSTSSRLHDCYINMDETIFLIGTCGVEMRRDPWFVGSPRFRRLPHKLKEGRKGKASQPYHPRPIPGTSQPKVLTRDALRHAGPEERRRGGSTGQEAETHFEDVAAFGIDQPIRPLDESATC